MAKNKAKSEFKNVWVVRKHIIDSKSKTEIRHEDYPEQFSSPAEAESFRQKKMQKYAKTIDDLLEDGTLYSEIPERREYTVQMKNVLA